VPRRFIIHVLLGAFAILAAAATFNYVVDPFQQFRKATAYEPRFYRSYQRYVNAGVARNYDYDRVVIGSSFWENITGSEVDRAFGGGKTMSLCTSAMTAYDARKLLEVAFASHRVKQVIYNVDYNAFSGAPDRSGVSEPLPLYLYDARHWNDYPYLLSMLTLRKGFNIAMKRHEEGYRSDPDAPWYWADTAQFGAKSVLGKLDPANLNLRFQQPPRTLEEMKKSFEANVRPLVAAHPETEFDFAWPPYSILVWVDFRERKQLELSLAFKRWFFTELSRYPNVKVFDFQDREDWVYDVAEYRDIYHFSPKYSSGLIRDIAAGRHQVTAENLDRGIQHLHDMAMAADLQRILAEWRSR
jgi:hypothetical protein